MLHSQLPADTVAQPPPAAGRAIGGGSASSTVSGGRARAVGLANDLTAPVLLSFAAWHELLYDHAGWPTWLLALTLIWPLVRRRQAPVLVFTICLAVAVALWLRDTFSVADLALLVALYSVAAHRNIKQALTASVAVALGAVLVAVRFAPAGSINDALVLLGGLTAAALFLGTTMRAQRRYLTSVEDRARRLELERTQQAALAAGAERNRIAREMHDIVAHGLAVVITLSEGAAVAATQDADAAAHAMRQAAAAGRQSLDEMRNLLQVLRADTVPDGAPQPSLTSLDVLLDDVRRTGLTVQVISSGDSQVLAPTAQATVYRIVQEALTNVLKHAEHASEVTITLEFDPSETCFTVENDGGRPTRHAASTGNGVTGMRERVAMFGGLLEAGPSATGWLVRGRLRSS